MGKFLSPSFLRREERRRGLLRRSELRFCNAAVTGGRRATTSAAFVHVTGKCDRSETAAEEEEGAEKTGALMIM
jgi:hypothetical protein